MIDGFSIIMPTYNQAYFIRRAILSLQKQTYPNWELIIVNDGCTDETEIFITDYLDSTKVKYIKNDSNQGLGYALNQGLNAARYNYIAYLPSDDFFFPNHLESIKNVFEKYDDITLVYTGMKYEYSDTLHIHQETDCKGVRKGYCLQLIQTTHKKTNERWLERGEWVTEDLFAMYWHKLIVYGAFCMTNQITCCWTSHPQQRHRMISEKYGGGLNKYRRFYKIKTPIKIKVSKYKFIDEEQLYSNFRKERNLCEHPLKILLVGELSYNPERIYALEEAGHMLYGLWMPNPIFSFSTVGHLPFGHVEDLSYDNWKEDIEKLQPDIIYALLNWGTVAWSCEILKAFPDIPFVWHFKEGPSACLHNGTWDKLMYLHSYSTGCIFLNETIKKWYEQFIPKRELSMIMDGDLPKREYFTDDFSSKLSQQDGSVHTIIAGRMIGISERDMEKLAQNNIHVHLYTENYHACKEGSVSRLLQVAPRHFHIHSHCDAADWVKEFSQYDAGWLHCLKSNNNGELLDMNWDDMNIPARINTYVAAGLPVILADNSQHIVATQEYVKKLNIGVLFRNYNELSVKLQDKAMLALLRNNVLKNRGLFYFDHYVPQLIQFFRNAIKSKLSV